MMRRKIPGGIRKWICPSHVLSTLSKEMGISEQDASDLLSGFFADPDLMILLLLCGVYMHEKNDGNCICN